MLSIEDIYREMGKNIYVCPVKTENFRDNSIDLTASEFAWTSKGVYIYDSEKDWINIPPHETACILTREAIYVKGKIGGTLHSRVSLVEEGFGHIGTMLDPEYCGQLLIMLHNTSDENQKIMNIKKSINGVRIVSLAFYYLKTPISEKNLATPPSHLDKISRLDTDGRYMNWLNSNSWINNPKNLKAHYKENYEAEFKKKRKIYAKRKSVVIRYATSSLGQIIIKYALIAIVIFCIYKIIDTYFKPAQSSEWAAIIVAIGVGLLGIIANDISKNNGR